MTEKSKDALRRVLGGVGIAIVLFVIVGDFVLLSSTLVRWPVAVGLAGGVGLFAAFAGRALWQKADLLPWQWANILLGAVSTGAILLGVVLGINYFCADASTFTPTGAVITARQVETRHRTRRVSRRVVSRGPAYKVSTITVDLDGVEITTDVKKSLYDKCQRGDTALVPVGRGALGLGVVHASELTLLHPRSRLPKSRRCRFVGPAPKGYEPPSLPKRYKKDDTHKQKSPAE